MVEKIIVSPESIRGLGNIVSPKTGADFEEYNCTLEVGEDTVNSETVTVYVLTPETTTISLVLSSSVDSCGIGDSVVLSVTVTEDSVPVSGGSVSFKLAGAEIGTGTTNSSGVATYTYTATDVGSLNFTSVYAGHSSNSVSVVVSHDYSIAFSQSSYPASSGSATLEMTLLDNSSPVSGATVSVTGSDSSSYSCTTNSSGVGTVTVSNVSSETTFTCTYGSVSDTCTVTVGPSYLFYDDCSSDRSSEYANASIQSSNRTNYLAMNYDSTNHRYGIKATSNEGNHYAKWITTLTGKDNIRFSCEVSTNGLDSTNRFGLIVGDSTAYKSMYFQITTRMEQQTMVNTTETNVSNQSISGLSANTWYKMVYEVEGTSFTFKLLDMSDNELYNKTGTFPSTVITSSTSKRYGLYYLNYYPSATKYYRNIKAESL